jgi:hypothetical protein
MMSGMMDTILPTRRRRPRHLSSRLTQQGTPATTTNDTGRQAAAMVDVRTRAAEPGVLQQVRFDRSSFIFLIMRDL